MTSAKKKHQTKRSIAQEIEAANKAIEEGTFTEVGPTEIEEPQAEAPAEPGEWDEAAQDIEAAIIPPPPLGSCGCGDSLRIEMLDAHGQPTGRHRTMGYKLAVAQVSAKRARYARE